jgi:single-stranded DNA-specific DHH superfamily exonuclease
MPLKRYPQSGAVNGIITGKLLKAIGIANAVKEQVNQNKENQRILAQATVEANDKIQQLEKQQAQLYAALMAKQPPAPLQGTTAATIKALTDKINRLERGGNNGGGGRGQCRKAGGQSFPSNGKDGTRLTRRRKQRQQNTINGSIRNLHLRA